MANEIKVGKNESIDSALRRFKRMSQKAGTLAEVRKREHYEKPSVRRKKKSGQLVNANTEAETPRYGSGACTCRRRVFMRRAGRGAMNMEAGICLSRNSSQEI